MGWDEQRFARFRDAVVAHARGQRPGYGHPHVLMPYDEREELAAIKAARELPAYLREQGLSARCEPIAQRVAEVLQRFATRSLPGGEEYDRLEHDLSGPVGVASLLASSLARTHDGSPPAVLILARLGALYPFAHVSATLEALYAAGLTSTLAVLYPGSADGLRLSFLGLVEPTGGYRGEIVT